MKTLSILRAKLEGLSIRSKLIGLLSLLVLFSTLVSVGLVVYSTTHVFETRANEIAEHLGGVIGEFSVAPLSFDDRNGAEEVLGNLAVIPAVVSAGVYNSKGELFAQYHVSKDLVSSLPDMLVNLPRGFGDLYLHTTHEIGFRGRYFGTVYVKTSLQKFNEELWGYRRKVLLIVCAVLILSLLLALRFERLISHRLLKLKEAANTVTEKGDFTIRVPKEGKDEIGELYIAFNTMLDKIHERELERDAAELEKLKLAKKLEHTQRLETIGTLAGGIAHDFNNLLMPLIHCFEVLERELGPNSSARVWTEIGREATERARELVRRILTFSHDVSEERRGVKLESIVEEATRLLRASFPASIEIRTEYNAKGAKIFADPAQMHQVIMNLCTNSFHAMQNNRGQLTVSVTLKQSSLSSDIKESAHLSANDVVLTISDTGCGIEQAILERVFEPFFTTKPVEVGTGLGLSVVHGIVKSHNGQIDIGSELNQGTTVTIKFPEYVDAEAEVRKEEPEIPRGKGHVLIVDDELLVGSVGKDILEKFGYTVELASDPREAFKLFEKHPQSFDAVLSDFTMPHLTGVELAEKLINIRKDIRVVLTSGFGADIPPEEELIQYGITEFINKPYRVRELCLAIKNAIELSSAQKAAPASV